MKAVIFDLDDTLYPEIEYVKSGFEIVANYLVSKYGFKKKDLIKRMLTILDKQGRGRIFNILLEDLGIYSQDMVMLLVYLYRSHNPTIGLFKDVLPTSVPRLS